VEKSREDASRILNKNPTLLAWGSENPRQQSGTVRKPLNLIPNRSPSFNLGFTQIVS
jgi:hypothetical protein